jgi:hypothetical protein
LRFGENLENCLNFRKSVLFFSIFASGAGIWLNVPKKGVFGRFDKRLFLWKCQKRHFRNVTSPRGGEHRIGRNILNFALIGCKSTKKVRKNDNFEKAEGHLFNRG